MALPKLETKTYTLTLPSTGEDIKFRPFLVKEQKILLMAQESKNTSEIADAMSQEINNNDIDFGQVIEAAGKGAILGGVTGGIGGREAFKGTGNVE